ncbi:transposase [Streptomyces sp. NPDC055796]
MARTPEEELSIVEVCAELKVSKSTFYDWRQKRRASRSSP